MHRNLTKLIGALSAATAVAVLGLSGCSSNQSNSSSSDAQSAASATSSPLTAPPTAPLPPPEALTDVLSRLADFARTRGAEPADAGRSGVIGLVRAVQSEPQREALDQLLVLGTLLEGHADHVMDAVGPVVVPSVATIRRRFDERRNRRQPPLQRLLRETRRAGWCRCRRKRRQHCRVSMQRDSVRQLLRRWHWPRRGDPR